MKSSTLRLVIPLMVILILTIGYVFSLDFGTLSAAGWSWVSIMCPLGALTTALAEKAMIPRAAISFVIVLVLIIVFGKAFCAWICPVPVVRKLRKVFGLKEKPALASPKNEPLSIHEVKSLKSTGCSSCAKKRGAVVDSRHIILGGSVLTALVFGFPVFCLVCPIGLTFGTIFLVVNLFTAGDMTWAVVLVPLLLLVEVVFFRKWCSKICPLSAFMSLTGKVGRFFRPKIDDSKCIETTSGKPCGICGEVCPESIDPRHPDISESALSECTKCRVCVDKCPSNAIKLPVWSAGNLPPQEVEKPFEDKG